MALKKFTVSFSFQNSEDPLLQSVWRRVDKSLPLHRVGHGLAHVSNGTAGAPAALVVDGATAARVLSERCDLESAGELGPARLYALAVPRGSRHRAALSERLARYAEDGTLARLRSRWLPRGRPDCLPAAAANPGSAPMVRDVDTSEP